MNITALPTVPLGIGALLYLVVIGSVIRIPRWRRPTVGPQGERIHKNARRRKFTKRERAIRIDGRIQKAGPKGITIRRLARLERISTGRIRFYLRLIRKSREKQGVKVERLGKRFFYVKLAEPERPKQLVPQRGDVELRAYWNYDSPNYAGHDIDIDCVVVVPNSPNAIVAARERVKGMVRNRLSEKIASKLHFGVSEATPQSSNHFLWRRGSGDQWHEL